MAYIMAMAILALYRLCFFTLHHASTSHLLCWGGPCKFRVHSDGCTGTVRLGKSIAANERQGAYALFLKPCLMYLVGTLLTMQFTQTRIAPPAHSVVL